MSDEPPARRLRWPRVVEAVVRIVVPARWFGGVVEEEVVCEDPRAADMWDCRVWHDRPPGRGRP